MKPFQQAQLNFTAYLRGAAREDTAVAQKPRRQEIYLDLVYKNINQCIADVFPTAKSIIRESDWEKTIRKFIRVHPLQTPYFLEICQEFLAYFVNTRKLRPTDHPFVVELMHFEWIQLAIYIADINFPETINSSAPTDISLWKASPLVIGLTYSYPVHIIDEDYLPKELAAQPTYLMVYRNRNDDLKVLETDDLSLRIIQLLQTHENINYSQIFHFFSEDFDNHHKEILLPKILEKLSTLAKNELILCS